MVLHPRWWNVWNISTTTSHPQHWPTWRHDKSQHTDTPAKVRKTGIWAAWLRLWTVMAHTGPHLLQPLPCTLLPFLFTPSGPHNPQPSILTVESSRCPHIPPTIYNPYLPTTHDNHNPFQDPYFFISPSSLHLLPNSLHLPGPHLMCVWSPVDTAVSTHLSPLPTYCQALHPLPHRSLLLVSIQLCHCTSNYSHVHISLHWFTGLSMDSLQHLDW